MRLTKSSKPEPSNLTRPDTAEPTATEPVTAGPETAPESPMKDDPQTREALIRLMAYKCYERRGFVSGRELEDWLEAEMEVDRQMAGEPQAADPK